MPGENPHIGASTAWVWVVLVTSLPRVSVASVWMTIVVRPTWTGVEVNVTTPSLMPRMKFVFDSIVVVPAPTGRLFVAHNAPTESATAIKKPPCSAPIVVQTSGRQAAEQTTCSGDDA